MSLTTKLAVIGLGLLGMICASGCAINKKFGQPEGITYAPSYYQGHVHVGMAEARIPRLFLSRSDWNDNDGDRYVDHGEVNIEKDFRYGERIKVFIINPNLRYDEATKCMIMNSGNRSVNASYDVETPAGEVFLKSDKTWNLPPNSLLVREFVVTAPGTDMNGMKLKLYFDGKLFTLTQFNMHK